MGRGTQQYPRQKREKPMKFISTATVVATLLGSSLAAADYEFNEPQIMKADGKVIEVESPGYAAPCLADLDGDGIRDLLVGQYNEGKFGFYKGLKTEDGTLAFATREWLKAGDEIAKVPGIW